MQRLLCLFSLLVMLAGCAAKESFVDAAATTGRAADGLTDEYYFAQFAHIPWTEIGRSVEGRPIYMTEFGSGDDVTLFYSCFHGGERSTPRFGFEFADMLHKDPSLIAAGKRVIVVPIQNPDGFVRGTRRNARNVDLNRNYPTRNWGHQPEGRHVFFGEAPASEPETQTVLKMLAMFQPTRILTIHQPLGCNNPDGPAGLGLATLMAQYNKYPVEPYIGFPTPGSFGTYAGKELEIPMVTLELPGGSPDSEEFDKMWEDNREALLAFVNCNLEDLE